MPLKSCNNYRNKTWDYARGVAIFMIVLHHFYARFYESPDGHANSFISLICYTCQLPIFMFISGLYAHKSINKYPFITFIYNKAIRLLLPFITFLIIWSLLRIESFPSTLLDNFKDGYWFTFVLFEIMLAVACVNFLAKKSELKLFYFTTIFFTFVTFFKLLFPQGSMINGLFSINLLCHYFPFFLIGFYSHRLHFIFKLKLCPIYLLIFIFSFFFFYHHQMPSFIPFCNLSSLLFLITIFNNGIRPLENSISVIGYYSLEIYLLHFFVRLIIVYVNSTNNVFLEFIFNIALAITAILISIYISKIIKKNKLLSLLLFGIKEKI